MGLNGALLTLTGVKKNYGKKVVLDGVDLTVESRGVVGIVGANGCGKSTLLAILAGILPADSGSFLYRNIDLLKDKTALRRYVGYLPQGTPLFEELSAYDNLRLWYDRDELEKELNGGILQTLGIGDFLKKKVSRLSGGMKKRLSIGCALSKKPEILLLDEPTAALDLPCKEDLRAWFSAFRDAGGLILLVTHDTQEIAMCDAVYVMKNGKLEPFVYENNAAELAEFIK